MGDPSNPKQPSISLPPGCRFYPSEEQLVSYYLTHKNNDDRRFGFDAINEIDLYNYNPFDLPDTACFRFGRGGRKRHWYSYVGTRVLKQGGRRRADDGYWRRRGRGRYVVGGGKVVVGTRRSFVFYLGDSLETAASTDWVMYEYAPIDRHEASFILCRLFVKSTCRNNNSEHVISSCGEGSVGTLPHIGIQHDGTITSDIVEGIVHDEASVDKKNEVLAGNVSTTWAVAHAGVQVPSSVQPNEPICHACYRIMVQYMQVTASGLTGAASMLIGCFAAHHSMSILEEDYIELDDLAGPLSGIDFT